MKGLSQQSRRMYKKGQESMYKQQLRTSITYKQLLIQMVKKYFIVAFNHESYEFDYQVYGHQIDMEILGGKYSKFYYLSYIIGSFEVQSKFQRINADMFQNIKYTFQYKNVQVFAARRRMSWARASKQLSKELIKQAVVKYNRFQF